MGCMNGSGVGAAVEVLVGTELSVADHAALADASRAVARLSSFVDLAKVQIARRGRELAEQGDSSSVHALIDDAGCTGRDVHATNGRDRVCGTVPGFEEALAAGDVSGAHLDSLAQHTTGLSDEERSDIAAIADELLDAAVSQHPGLFDRTVKDRIDSIRNTHRPDTAAEELERQRKQSSVRRWTDRDTGMRNTMITLDPIRDETLWNTINAQLATLRQDPANAARPFGELQVDALLAAVNSTPVGRRVPEIVVHVDDQTLCHGRHDNSLCETADGSPVPGPLLERWCCEAVLQAVVRNPDGTVDRLCAEHRTANRAQRRMLEAMYATCAHPHCTVAFSACRIHHIVWWTRGGKTVMANLLPLCETHHHLVHEGGWTLTIDDQRQVTWTRPDSTVSCTTGPNRRPDQRPPAECERPPSPPTDTARPAGTRPDRPPGPTVNRPAVTAEQTTLL